MGDREKLLVGDHFSVHVNDGLEDVYEVGVTHVGVDLSKGMLLVAMVEYSRPVDFCKAQYTGQADLPWWCPAHRSW
jgi:hypothetical protein